MMSAGRRRKLACSRLSVVGREKRESERKNKGGLSPPSFFPRSFSLVLNYREPETGYNWTKLSDVLTNIALLDFLKNGTFRMQR